MRDRKIPFDLEAPVVTDAVEKVLDEAEVCAKEKTARMTHEMYLASSK